MKSFVVTSTFIQLVDPATVETRVVSSQTHPRLYNQILKLVLSNDVDGAFEYAGKALDESYSESINLEQMRGNARSRIISQKTRGRFTMVVKDNGQETLSYTTSEGEQREVHGAFFKRLAAHFASDEDVAYLDAFLANVEANKYSKTGADDLFEFLAVNNHPITTDGCFLAFKIVKSDLTDFHTGTIHHGVGNIVALDPKQVDYNRDRTCSSGLHFCSRDYLPQYGGFFGNRDDCALLVLKINPADVAAFPRDYHNAKGRAIKYQVLARLPNDGYHHIIERILSQPVIDISQEVTDVEFVSRTVYQAFSEADLEDEVEKSVQEQIAEFNASGGPTPTIATSRWIVESVNSLTRQTTCVGNESTRQRARELRDELNRSFKTQHIEYRVRDRDAD